MESYFYHIFAKIETVTFATMLPNWSYFCNNVAKWSYFCNNVAKLGVTFTIMLQNCYLQTAFEAHFCYNAACCIKMQMNCLPNFYQTVTHQTTLPVTLLLQRCQISHTNAPDTKFCNNVVKLLHSKASRSKVQFCYNVILRN